MLPGLGVIDTGSPVSRVFALGDLAGSPFVSAMSWFAVALLGVVYLVAFGLVVADGVPSRLSVSCDNPFELPLAAVVHVPDDGGNHCKEGDPAHGPGRSGPVNVDQGVSGVILGDPTSPNLCVGVDVSQSLNSDGSGDFVAVARPEDVE